MKTRWSGLNTSVEAEAAEAAVADFRRLGQGRTRSLEEARLGSERQQVSRSKQMQACLYARIYVAAGKLDAQFSSSSLA